MRNLIILENCGIGAQLLNISHGINKDALIIDGIQHPYTNQNFKVSSLINEFFSFDCEIVHTPFDSFTKELFENYSFYKKVSKGYINPTKYKIFTLERLFPESEDELINHLSAPKIYKFMETKLKTSKKNLEVLKKMCKTKLIKNSKYNSKTGIHVRLSGDKLFSYELSVPNLLKTKCLRNRYIVIDNWKTFNKFNLTNLLNSFDELEYEKNINEYINSVSDECNNTSLEQFYNFQRHSMQIAANLASCKKIYLSSNSAFGNIIVTLLSSFFKEPK